MQVSPSSNWLHSVMLHTLGTLNLIWKHFKVHMKKELLQQAAWQGRLIVGGCKYSNPFQLPSNLNQRHRTQNGEIGLLQKPEDDTKISQARQDKVLQWSILTLTLKETKITAQMKTNTRLQYIKLLETFLVRVNCVVPSHQSHNIVSTHNMTLMLVHEQDCKNMLPSSGHRRKKTAFETSTEVSG